MGEKLWICLFLAVIHLKRECETTQQLGMQADRANGLRLDWIQNLVFWFIARVAIFLREAGRIPSSKATRTIPSWFSCSLTEMAFSCMRAAPLGRRPEVNLAQRGGCAARRWA